MSWHVDGSGFVDGYEFLPDTTQRLRVIALPITTLTFKVHLIGDISAIGTALLCTSDDEATRYRTGNGGGNVSHQTGISNTTINGVTSTNLFTAVAGDVISFDAVMTGDFFYLFGARWPADTESTGLIFSKIEVWNGLTQIREYDATLGGNDLIQDTINGVDITQYDIGVSPPPPTLIIDGVTDPLGTNSAITVDGSGFEAQGAGSLIAQTQGINGAPLNITSWSDTQITADSLDVESTQLKYGTHEIVVVADGGASSSKATQSIPLAGSDYVDLTSIATDGVIVAIPDLEALDQVRYDTLGGRLTVNPDATFSALPSLPEGTYPVEMRAWDHNDSTWGSVGVQTIAIGGGIPAEITGKSRNELLAQIVVASGGIVTNPSSRNSLLQDWLNAL